MVGSLRNTEKALEHGADIIIAQGTEGGGHTGEITTMVLIPQVVDLCKGKTNFLGKPVIVVAAGGIYDGRGLAAALHLGASGVWVGTRFVACEEASAPKAHKEAIVKSESSDTIRSLAISGRPLRLVPNEWIKSWENRPAEMKALLDQGVTPLEHDLKHNHEKVGMGPIMAVNLLSGQAAGGITSIQPAKTIIDEMVRGAIETMQKNMLVVSKL